MEDKENVNESTWNQMDSTLEKNLASPKALKSPTILKQITTAINCNPLASTTAVVSEPAETKNKAISYNQNFLSKRSIAEKQVKTAAPNPGACLSEKRVLGTYRGRIVSSKINSFRKRSENENTRYSLAAAPKLAMTGFTTNSTGTRNTRVTGTVSKAAGITSLQARPPIKVSVSHPKTILNQEKPSVSSTVNKGTAQRNPDRNWKPVLKTGPPNASNSVHRTKKPVPPKTETGILVRLVSETHSIVSASKSVDNRKSILAKPADLRRTQLAEWRASKGIKKVPAPISDDTQPEIETPQQTVKEPVESFWAAIAEEDEQRLVSDSVNKTLAECLSLIEKGYPGDTVHSTLEKLIMTVPDAKRFAKYWVCQMRLEQFRSTEKVLGIYENAILAGAQPKDELRHAFTDAMKTIKNLSKSDDECVKNENPLNHEAEVNSHEGKIKNAFKEVRFSKNNNEETSQKATEGCLKSEQESFPHERKQNKELSQKPTVLQKAEQSSGNEEKDQILELNSPENDNAGSYLIKYNLSTTPSLERTKKNLQGGANDSAVKDLKFLTPVRRSRRINEQVCKLPSMLKDHNPCVSSLEQLGELGDEGTGIVYRQNSALPKVTLHQQGQGKA